MTSVTLNELSGPIAVGASIPLEAILSPSDATSQNIVFESADTNIGTVDENGVFTAVTEGEVTITVTSSDGGFVDSKVIQVLTPSSEFNWALGQPTTGTGISDGPNVVANIVDNSTGTRWSVNGFPQSAIVDLGDTIAITQTEVTCFEDRAYQFTLEVADNIDGPYTTIADRTNNRMQGTPATPIINSVDGVTARFVRITVASADVYTGPWVSLTELRIFGEGERMSTSVNDFIFDKVVLSPNPATSIVNIENGEDFDFVTIYDQSGKIILQRNLNTSKTIDVSALQSGIFIVKLEGKDQPLVTKLIKQ